jgi:hypothetical protein
MRRADGQAVEPAGEVLLVVVGHGLRRVDGKELVR